MFSKSLFGNLSNNKSIINPIGNTTIPFYQNELKFSINEYSKIYDFNKKYENIEDNQILSDFEEYVELLNILSNVEVKIQNSNIGLLLKITRNGLINTIKAFGLNIDNIKLNIKNLLLQNKIDSIVSTKNEYPLIASVKNDYNSNVLSENSYSLEKHFTLSPIFSYYISLFGIPEEGLGFDLDKIQIIKKNLETNQINPYI